MSDSSVPVRWTFSRALRTYFILLSVGCACVVIGAPLSIWLAGISASIGLGEVRIVQEIIRSVWCLAVVPLAGWGMVKLRIASRVQVAIVPTLGGVILLVLVGLVMRGIDGLIEDKASWAYRLLLCGLGSWLTYRVARKRSDI